MNDELGLRERKKRETRRLLAEVATRLFDERGFESVTIADIATAGHVSTKTVFNYFATKEDLVLDGRLEVEDELLRAVLARPPGEPVVETVRRHTLGVAERMNLLPAERRNAFRRLVANVPSIHLRMRELSARTEDELARILAVETGKPATDSIARMVASVLGVLTRLAFGVVGSEAKRWNHASIIASIHEGFDLLSQGLGSYGVRQP